MQGEVMQHHSRPAAHEGLRSIVACPQQPSLHGHIRCGSTLYGSLPRQPVVHLLPLGTHPPCTHHHRTCRCQVGLCRLPRQIVAGLGAGNVSRKGPQQLGQAGQHCLFARAQSLPLGGAGTAGAGVGAGLPVIDAFNHSIGGLEGHREGAAVAHRRRPPAFLGVGGQEGAPAWDAGKGRGSWLLWRRHWC